MRTIQKQELGMCEKTGNTCGQFKNRNQVCAKKLETHADSSKQELGMYNKSENTCLKAKNNDPACMITGKTHAQQAKTENRYVNCFRKHMYKIKK